MNSIVNLKGKVVLITGGSAILGSNMANVLAKQGAIVGIVARTIERAEATVSQIISNAGEAFALKANVLNKEELEAARDFVIEKQGR